MRVDCEPGRHGARGSWATGSRVDLIQALRNDFLSRASGIGERLIAAMDKERGVALVIVQSDFSYEIKFEWDDMNRWMITKLNGATGVPAGLETS